MRTLIRMSDNNFFDKGAVLCRERDESHCDFATRQPGGMKPCTVIMRLEATSQRRIQDIAL